MNNIYDVCDFILFHEDVKHKRTVTNFRMQYFLYFVQSEFFRRLDEPCFAENMVGWRSGPVVPEIYERYRKYGKQKIETSDFENLADAQSKLENVQLIEAALRPLEDSPIKELAFVSQRQTPWIVSRNRRVEISPAIMREVFGQAEMTEATLW